MSGLSQLVDSLFPKKQVDIDDLATRLDAMSSEERLGWMRKQNLASQAGIWAAAAGRGVTLEHLVPPEVPSGLEVIHEGKNSLPVFSLFQKRFARDAKSGGMIFGYNEGSTRKLIGPGYFIAEYDDVRMEVGVNYYRVPPEDTVLPEGWPQIVTNEEGLQRFVFSTMVDYLRVVSSHVSIGRASKANKEQNNYFLLCRRVD